MNDHQTIHREKGLVESKHMLFIFVLTHVLSCRKPLNELNQLTKWVIVTFRHTSNLSMSYSNPLRRLIQFIERFPTTHHVSKHKNEPHML